VDSSIERRVVSVMFCDLVGFTSMSEQLDAEDVAIVQDAYFSAVREAVGRHGGTLEKFIGDAAVAAFGVPVAREDDAERAVRAGLALTNAVEQLSASLSLPTGDLAVRVGVNTGETAVHVDAGPGEAMLTGDAVNLAARLQSSAPIGGVLVGPTTALTVADAIALEPVDPLSLKGKADPVRASIALGPLPERSREAAMGRLRAPTVGRERELTLLEEALARTVHTGAARWVFVAPPGVGKTRLVTEFGERAGAQGAVVLATRLRPEIVGPLQPVANLLVGALTRAGVEVRPEGDRDGARDLLVERLRGAGSGPAAADRTVRAALDTAWPVESDDGPAVPQAVLQTAWIEALDALAGTSSTVWIVEDLHWAGPDLLAFLAEALERPRPGGRLVVCTARPALLESAGDWAGSSSVLVELPPLSMTDSVELIGRLVGDALPEELAAQIAERSDGNALFIEELLRAWVSAGTLEARNGDWTIVGGQHMPAVPATVQAIYAAQLDDLPPAARMVARRASVAGLRFPVESLGSLEIPDADDGVASLLRRELISGPAEAGVFGAAYAFRHALLRDAAYASMARAERGRLHIRLARWFEALPSSGRSEVAAMIGSHYEQAVREAPSLAPAVGGGLSRSEASRLAADWLLRSLESGAINSAYRAANAVLDRATGLAGDPQAEPELAARIGLARSRLAFLEGDAASALEFAGDAMRIGERIGSGQLIVDATMSQAWPLAGSDIDRSWKLAETALHYPEADAIELVYERPRTLFGIVLMYRGEIEAAREVLSEQLDTAIAAGDRSSTSGIRMHLSELEFRAGRFRAGLGLAEAGLKDDEERGEVQAVSAQLYVKALHEGMLGKVELGEADARRGIEIDLELGDEVFRAQNQWVLGLLALSNGLPEEAAMTLAPLAGIAERVGAKDPNSWLLFLPDLVEALLGDGRPDEAEDHTRTLETRADHAGLPRGLSVSARCRALMLLARGQADAAIDSAAAAAEVPGIEHQPFEVARAVGVRGVAEQAAGRFDAADATLAEAVHRFDLLEARRWAARARSAQREEA
jgi:class 3 adenylate cyclase